MKTTDQYSIENLLLREGGYQHLPESPTRTTNHIASAGKMVTPANLQTLKVQAESLIGWKNIKDAWLDTSEDSACAVVGHIGDDGELYPVAVVDCDQYDQPLDSMKLAKFYASVNPKAILELIVAYEDLRSQVERSKSIFDFLASHDAKDAEGFELGIARIKLTEFGGIQQWLWVSSDLREVHAAMKVKG